MGELGLPQVVGTQTELEASGPTPEDRPKRLQHPNAVGSIRRIRVIRVLPVPNRSGASRLRRREPLEHESDEWARIEPTAATDVCTPLGFLIEVFPLARLASLIEVFPLVRSD